MTYNNSHQSSVDEIILPIMEFRGVSKKNKDLEFVNDWVDVTVENEIWRGKQLRGEKPIPDDTEYEYNVANIDFLGSFVNGKPQCRSRRDHLKYYKMRTSPSTPRSKSPYPRPTTAASAYFPMNRNLRATTSRIKTKSPKKCSMRIAELAVPTKRQCIDTWRNKSNILPEFMVERLKQHVMDQRPIVKIPDAIYCFQRRRPQPSKTCFFKYPQNKNENNYEVLKPSREMDTRTLCIVFAHKMAKRLSKPLNLTLNLELEKLSRVVSSDIGKLLAKCPFSKNQQYIPIHMDVANKITVWIAGIMEDLSLKLLEEDLRVKMENAANAKISEHFVTVMETIIQQEKLITSTDLEEEEGPVLDFIDDVVENVLNICEPPPVYVDSESDTAESSKDEEIMGEELEQPVTSSQSSDIKMSKLEEIFNTDIEEPTDGLTEDANNLEGKDDILSNTEHFRSEINNIIDFITKDSGDDMSNGSGDDIENVYDKTITPDGEMEDALEDVDFYTDQIDDTQIDYTQIDDTQKDDIQIDDNQIDDTQNIKLNNEDEEAIDNGEVNDSNVSEGFEILNEDDDKSSKKVMFFKTDLVNSDNIAEQNKTRSNEREQNQWNAQNEKSTITFSEPNEHLLSDADESWPADLYSGSMIKLSNSVSKSVISLGKINENDERHISPSKDDVDLTEKRKSDNAKILEKNIVDKLKSLIPTEKHDSVSQSGKPQQKITKETKTIEPQVDSKTLDDKETGKIESKLFDESNEETHKIMKIESDIVRTASTAGRSEDNKIPSHKTQSQIDYGWKVHLKTAPSWVTAWGQGRGEPSEDSIPIQLRRTKVTEGEIRKWCKDLEKAFINLEMWSHWISNTCKETVFLSTQNDFPCTALAKKGAINWIRLKKDIHKDAILWRKLYQRTENNFTSLKRKYTNIEFSSNKLSNSSINREILETFCEFENLSLELHKMIVAAEYCAICTCDRRKTR